MMPRLLTHLSTILWGIGAVGTLVLHSMGLIPDDNLVPVFFVIICLYIFYSVVQNWHQSTRMDKLELLLNRNFEQISQLHPDTGDNLRIRLIDNPKDESIWSGITREFDMFNPPLTIASEDLLSTFADIFRTPSLKKVRILLFEGITADEQDRHARRIERLKTLIAKASGNGRQDEIRHKIQIRVVPQHSIPESTFFLGYRLKQPVGIMYVYPLVFGEQPHSGFEIKDKNTLNLLAAEFNARWNAGSAIQLN